MAKVHWTLRCSKCDRRKSVFVERGSRWCAKCAEVEQSFEVRRALIRHRYGTDPANYTADVLRKIADTIGVMDANALFAPAGKLTMEETKRREAAAILSRASQ